ncbi:MAG TPA: TatD family hydrolase [Syntrophobacteria bacterium]|nr:TatD family hydrolase [Syntrophobacteria bacterium]
MIDTTCLCPYSARRRCGSRCSFPFAELMLIDTHCHLDLKDFDGDRPAVLRRALESGVGPFITIGISLPSSRRAVALASQYDELYATVGIHPHGACRLTPRQIEELLTLGREQRVVAYGEIGLDFYRDRQPRPVQRSCFGEQLALARQLGLPVVVHDRDAHEETLEILRAEKTSAGGGVMHCFSGDWRFAQRCLDLNLYIAIAGPVTFHTAANLHDVVRRCPLDRLLLETDAPFLTPVPERGRRNEPAFLRHTAAKVAALRKTALAEISRQTSENARRLFRLPEPAEPSPIAGARTL